MAAERKRGADGKFISSPPPVHGEMFRCVGCGVEKLATKYNFRIINKGKSWESLSKLCRVCMNAKDRKAYAEGRTKRSLKSTTEESK